MSSRPESSAPATGRGWAARRWDVVVVGAGASGCALAARLSENADRSVLLLEAGAAPAPEAAPRELLDASVLRGVAPSSPVNWALPAHLVDDGDGRPYAIARGRILGGSTSINGAYFVRPRRADTDAWQAAGGPAWSHAELLRLGERLEHDLDFGADALHGDRGPMPVSRVATDELHPIASAFVEAASRHGFPSEPDKNGDAPPGIGPLPRNVRHGVRVNAALAYLGRAADRPNLAVVGGAEVRRVRFDRARAIGVDVQHGGEVAAIAAGEVVLSAGAMLTPRVLLASGIGPEAQLAEFGVSVVADLPGVGAAFMDHPNLSLAWRARDGVPPPGGSAFEVVLNARSSGAHAEANLEVLPAVASDAHLFGHAADGRYSCIVALQAPLSRGTMRLASADPTAPLDVRYRYLALPDDRRRMRDVVRLGARLLRSEAMAGVVESLIDLDDSVLEQDDALDRWIRARLGTAIHACGSAPMGADPAAGAVVDGTGRVHGVTGLRIADTSILPTAPHRGPSYSAVLVGERIAESMRAGF